MRRLGTLGWERAHERARAFDPERSCKQQDQPSCPLMTHDAPHYLTMCASYSA